MYSATQSLRFYQRVRVTCYNVCYYFITRNAFCGTWYLSRSHVRNERTIPIIMARSSSSSSSSSTNFIATQVLQKTSGPLCVTCCTSVNGTVTGSVRCCMIYGTVPSSVHAWMPPVTTVTHAGNGRISTSGLKSDVTIVFLDPDFLLDAKISAIRIHLRQI